MNTVAQRDFIRSQILDLDRLIEVTGDNPLMSPGLLSRKADFERRLAELPAYVRRPQTTFYFAGGPVRGSTGIDAEFTSKVLNLVQDMTTIEFLQRKHGVVGSRGPVAKAPEARLMLTALPRGSFGLELRPANEVDLIDDQHLGDALQHFTELLGAASNSDASFETALAEAPVRLLPKLKDFFQTLATFDAQLRLVTGDSELELNQTRISAAVERVQATQTQDEQIILDGFFRGATLDSRKVDFKPLDQDGITARLADEITEDEVGDLRLNARLRASFRRTSIVPRGGTPRHSYELLSFNPPDVAAVLEAPDHG